jgi:hypothetical protein
MIITGIETFPLRIPFKPGNRSAASALGLAWARRIPGIADPRKSRERTCRSKAPSLPMVEQHSTNQDLVAVMLFFRNAGLGNSLPIIQMPMSAYMQQWPGLEPAGGAGDHQQGAAGGGVRSPQVTGLRVGRAVIRDLGPLAREE